MLKKNSTVRPRQRLLPHAQRHTAEDAALAEYRHRCACARDGPRVTVTEVRALVRQRPAVETKHVGPIRVRLIDEDDAATRDALQHNGVLTPALLRRLTNEPQNPFTTESMTAKVAVDRALRKMHSLPVPRLVLTHRLERLGMLVEQRMRMVPHKVDEPVHQLPVVLAGVVMFFPPVRVAPHRPAVHVVLLPAPQLCARDAHAAAHLAALHTVRQHGKSRSTQVLRRHLSGGRASWCRRQTAAASSGAGGGGQRRRRRRTWPR